MLDKLFSIKEADLHYIVKFCGVKFKIMNSKKAFAELKKFRQQMKRSQIPTIYNTNLTQEQKIWFLSQKFYEEVGYYPDFKSPRSFNEKINWIKLNYYNPLEGVCIDKYTFKEYIKAKLGEEYVIPTIGIYKDVNDIDFDKLPQRFVMKVTTSGSGEGVEIVKDKSKINIDELKYKFNNLLQEWNSIYYYCLSRGYKDIKPRIIIEEYLEQENGQLYDYKFMCFNSNPRWVLACSNRNKNTVYENHDLDWKLMIPSARSAKKSSIDCPKNFETMLKIAKDLSTPFPFVRVDFYEVNNRIYIGELTFTPNGGFNTYYKDWDYKIGTWLDLNNINSEYINTAKK